MNILAIDTATEQCSVAVGCSGVIHHATRASRVGHSQVILDLVAEVLEQSGVTLEQLHLVAVDVGPGSFTGLRVGIGVAKGIAYGRNLPMAGHSSLAILAAQCQPGLVLPAIDARMGQVYYGVFEVSTDQPPIEVEAIQVTDPGDVRLPEASVQAIGSGWDIYHAQLAGPATIYQNRAPCARELVQLAASTASDKWLSALELNAVYVRNQIGDVRC